MKQDDKRKSRFDKITAKREISYSKILIRMIFTVITPAVLIFIIQTGVQLVKADVVIDDVPVAAYPMAVAVNPITNKIYVASYREVTVIDGKNNSSQSVKVGNGIDGIAIDLNANKIYVCTRFSVKGEPIATLVEIDGADNSTKTIHGIRWSWWYPGRFSIVAYNPQTSKIYVRYSRYGRHPLMDMLIEVDGGSGKAQIVSWGFFSKGAVNIVTNMLFIADYRGTVTVINLADYSTHIVQAGEWPKALAVNPVTNTVYVANFESGDVTVMDGTIYRTDTVAVGKAPLGVAVNSETNKIYVTDSGSDSVTVIDGKDNSTITVPTGQNPQAVTVNPATNKIYVANCDSGDITVIDGKDNSTETVAVGKTPVAIAVSPVKDLVFVVNRDSDTLTVIDGSSGFGPFMDSEADGVN